MIKAVFFDLDGTIGDTLPLCVEAFKRAIEPLAGRTFTNKEIMDTFGPSEEGTISALIPEHFDEGIERYLKYYKQLHDLCPKPFDGMIDILEFLKTKGIIMALITGKGRRSADITLPIFNIESYFAAVETGTPAGLKKIEDIKKLLKQFNLAPDEVIYVGDLQSDIQAAREAGIFIISAAWAETADREALLRLNPDATIKTIEEFDMYIKSVVQ